MTACKSILLMEGRDAESHGTMLVRKNFAGYKKITLQRQKRVRLPGYSKPKGFE